VATLVTAEGMPRHAVLQEVRQLRIKAAGALVRRRELEAGPQGWPVMSAPACAHVWLLPVGLYHVRILTTSPLLSLRSSSTTIWPDLSTERRERTRGHASPEHG